MTNLLEELLNKNPLELTTEDLDNIISNLRAEREIFLKEETEKKPRATKDSYTTKKKKKATKEEIDALLNLIE